MKYLATWRGLSIRRQAVSLIWSDSVIGWCSRHGCIQLACDLCLAYLYLPNFKHQLQKILLEEKNDWMKNKPFFITENFLGILDSLCVERIRRYHDFLCLTLTVVGSTSGSCYFLLQCRFMWFCVLGVLVRRVKWVNQKRFDVFYYNRYKGTMTIFRSSD